MFKKANYVVPKEFSQKKELPIISTDKIESCIVCGGQYFKTIAYCMDYEMQTCGNVWEFQECISCGHVQLDPRPSITELDVIYPSTYYSYDMSNTLNPIAIKGKRFLDRLKFDWFLTYVQCNVESYLDVGCGDCKYLDEMCRRGLSKNGLIGLELNDSAVEVGIKRGYKILNERVEVTTSIPNNSLDLVTMFHVIEHVSEPEVVISRIYEWLHVGGVFVLETPNYDALDAKLFRGEYWGGYHTPRHWHIFNSKNLTTLLEKNGFEVKAVRYQTGHSFWLFSLHHFFRFNRIFPLTIISRFFHPLKNVPVLILMTGFDYIRSKLGFRTSAMLLVAKKL